jgi:hypothetical protein
MRSKMGKARRFFQICAFLSPEATAQAVMTKRQCPLGLFVRPSQQAPSAWGISGRKYSGAAAHT